MRFITAVILLLLVSIPARSQLFEQNVGQLNRLDVEYLCRIDGMYVLFSDRGLTYVHPHAQGNDTLYVSLNQDAHSQLVAEKTASHELHYYSPTGVFESIFSARQLRYREVKPGVDVVFYIHNGSLKYDIEAKSGLLAEQMSFRYHNAELTLLRSGELQVEFGLQSQLIEDAPVSWVQTDRQQEVNVDYAVDGQQLHWIVQPEFRDTPITIDPGVRWSLLHGGGRAESRVAVATDATNNVFVGGTTESIQWGSNGFSGVSDVYVSRFDSQGELAWTVLYGGTDAEVVTDICVSSDGSKVYVAGYSESDDLPTNRQASSPQPTAPTFGFIAEFASVDGKHVISTRWGGGGECEILSIDCAANGDIVIGGKALSGWYPVSPNAVQTAFNGAADGFVARISGDLLGYDWSTLLGSNAPNDREVINGVTVMTNGDIGFTGFMSGSGFPITATAFQTANAGQADVVVGVLKGIDGDTLFSSYMGGASSDYAYSVVSDASGRLVVVGETASSQFPTTAGAAKSENTFNADAFVMKVHPATGNLEWSTLYGADDKEDFFRSVCINAHHDIVAVGLTGADDFPVLSPTFQNEYSGGREDAIVVAFSPTGVPTWNSFLGGSIRDEAFDISPLQSATLGDVVVVGRTNSSNFPVTALPLDGQKTLSGNYDSFVTVFNTCSAPQPLLEDKEICLGETVELHPINGSYSHYLWRESGANSIVGSSSGLEVSKPGKYSVVVTDAAGCSGVSNIASVDVLPMPSFDISLSNPNGDTTFCQGDQLTMQVHGTDIRTVKWSTGDEGSAYTFTEAGFYSVEIEGNNGCTTTANFQVQEIVVPTPVATPDTVVCRGEPVELYVESVGTSFQWFGENIAEAQKRRTLAYPTSDAVYNVRIEYRGCVETTTITVSVVEPPVQPESKELVACYNSPVDLMLLGEERVDVYEANGAIVCLDCPADATYTTTASTQLTAVYLNEGGCAVSTTLSIVVRDTSALTVSSADGTTVDFGVLQGCDIDVVDSIVLQNGQVADIVISHVYVDSPAFGVRSFDPAVASGDSAVIALSFSASSTGQFGGNVHVVLQPCGDTLSMPLKGARTSTNVELTVDGDEFVGSSAVCLSSTLSTTLTIRNAGEEIVVITAPINSSAFEFVSDPSGTVLNLGESRQFDVRFVAGARGSYSEDVGVSWESSSCTSASVVNLRAVATEPELSIAVSAIDFGQISPCTTLSVTTLSVTNTGNEPAQLAEVIGNPAFVVESATFIAPGATESIEVRYVVPGNGRVSDNVQLVFEPCTLTTTISISGAWWGPEFSVASAIDVTVSECTPTTTYTISIGNDSDVVPGTIVSVQVPTGFDFVLPADPNMDPRSQRDIQFVVDGTTPSGISTAIVSLVVDGCEQTVFVNTIVRLVETTVASTSVDLGTVPYNYDGTTTVTVVNTGETDLLLQDIELIGDNFELVSLPNAPLGPGETGNVVVRFTANGAGATRATVSYRLTGLCRLTTTSTIDVYVTEEPKDITQMQVNTSFHYVELQESGAAITSDLPFSGIVQGAVSDGLRLSIEYNATVLHVVNVMAPGQLISNTRENAVGTVRLSIPQEFVGENWSGLVVRPLLGNATTSSLTVVEASSGTARITSANGTVFITGFCEAGGTRLVRNTNIPQIIIRDNGTADAVVQIQDPLPESECLITDVAGNIVFRQRIQEGLTIRLKADIPNLSSGTYFVSLTNKRRMKTTLLQYNR